MVCLRSAVVAGVSSQEANTEGSASECPVGVACRPKHRARNSPFAEAVLTCPTADAAKGSRGSVLAIGCAPRSCRSRAPRLRRRLRPFPMAVRVGCGHGFNSPKLTLDIGAALSAVLGAHRGRASVQVSSRSSRLVSITSTKPLSSVGQIITGSPRRQVLGLIRSCPRIRS